MYIHSDGVNSATSFIVLTIQTEIKILLQHSYKLLKIQLCGTQKDETVFTSVNIQGIEKSTPRKKQGINSPAPSRNALQKEQVSYVS